MQVIVGRTAGFCGGVTNSVMQASEALEKYGNTFCLGELVHNKQVVDELESKGLITIDTIDDIKNERVIVRAHGIPKETYDLAMKNNLELIDLTCPNVLMVHKVAEEYANEKMFVVLIAQKSHPEAIGTISFCGINSMVVEDENDLDDLYKRIEESKLGKVAVIAQTTYSLEKFDMISNLIKDNVDKEVVINKTICLATSKRQEETTILAKEVDVMIIIGGKNSSNTKKLFEIANRECKNSYIVETVDDLNMDEIKKYEKVGVMAGASTPKKSIDDIVNLLK